MSEVVRLVSDEEAQRAIARLVAIARADTGQSKKVADFLLAWWNGDDNGHFPVSHLVNVDTAIRDDMLFLLRRIASEPMMIYADAFGFRAEMEELWQLWREPGTS
jgi:ATP-dependent DNA ligase